MGTQVIFPYAVVVGTLLAACGKGNEAKGTAASATAAPSIPSPTPSVVASAKPEVAGPAVSIPKGKLVAGTACGDHPKLPGEELEGEALEMASFDIDAYPYPNDPEKPPLTGVSREEAQKMCEARGRRLCTDLEWERACKGPTNTRYEYGDKFDGKACPPGRGAMPAYASFDKCVSGFGVHAMHGLAFEWTSSAWKRAKDDGKGVLRGGFGNQPYGHMRCTAVKEADPGEHDKSMGFRCCGGTANTAEVAIPADDPPPAVLAEETTVDEGLLGRLNRALVNGKYKDPEGATGIFTKVWRWHPAPKEEIVLARYETRWKEGGTMVQPFAVRICEKSVQLLGRIKGPVDKLEDPAVPSDASGSVAIHIESGDNKGDVKLLYQFGQVNLVQPAWVPADAKPAASSAGSSAPAPSASEKAPAPAASNKAPAPAASDKTKP